MALRFLSACFYFLLILTTGCNILQKNSETGLQDGKYKIKSNGHIQKAYAVFEDSVIRLFPFHKKIVATALHIPAFEFSETRKSDTSLHLKKNSFDFDVFTIPFKFRPSVSGFPNQLNTNFSGAFYIGYRNDDYHLGYRQTPLQHYKRKLNHFGYSIGLFSGFGSTAMNPWVTQNGITSEYDGLVILNGIAGIVAVGKLTFGLGIGADYLLDKNKSAWIYQGKPWVGLTIGLNLN